MSKFVPHEIDKVRCVGDSFEQVSIKDQEISAQLSVNESEW